MELFKVIDEDFICSDDNGLYFLPLKHIAHYIPERRCSDKVSAFIEDFKHDSKPHITQAWIDISCKCLAANNVKADYIVRALGHKELKASGTKGIDKLGAALQQTTGAKYIPEAILKHSENTALHTLKLGARKREIKGKYYWNPDISVPAKSSFIILDDIATSGTTLEHIAEVIRANVKGAKVLAYAIGRTIHSPGINDKFDLSPFKPTK